MVQSASLLESINYLQKVQAKTHLLFVFEAFGGALEQLNIQRRIHC